jgi:epoxyqueuosine reductase
MSDNIEKMRELFSNENIPVFGMGKAALLEQEPPGYRPFDILPQAKNMLCLGIPVPKGIFKSEERSEWTYWRAVNIYYRTIDTTLTKVCSILEAREEVAVPIYACFPYDIKGKGDFWGYMSLVRMGEAVGIGKLGKNGLLFNSRYGPRLLLGGIVTTASLPIRAWPEKDEKGCPKDCFACQEQCPVKAIDKSGKVDRVACLKHSMRSPIFSHFMGMGNRKTEEVQMINHVTAVDDHSMYRCIRCVSVCPF